MAIWTNEQKWANQPTGTWDGITIGNSQSLTWDDATDQWDGKEQTAWLKESKNN